MAAIIALLISLSVFANAAGHVEIKTDRQQEAPAKVVVVDTGGM